MLHSYWKADVVRHLQPGEILQGKEKKTGKARTITLNKSAVIATQQLLDCVSYDDTDFLSTGQRGVLSVPSVNRLVKGWSSEINLSENYGSHTLRKTFGYMQRTQLNTGFAELMVMFNHSSQVQTLDYLCI